MYVCIYEYTYVCVYIRIYVLAVSYERGTLAGEMGVGAEFRVNARRALTLMDRFPVSDDVTYTVDEAETLDDALADTLKVVIASFYRGKQMPYQTVDARFWHFYAGRCP